MVLFSTKNRDDWFSLLKQKKKPGRHFIWSLKKKRRKLVELASMIISSRNYTINGAKLYIHSDDILLKHRQFHFLFMFFFFLYSLSLLLCFVVVSISVVQILLFLLLLFIFFMSRFFQNLTLCQWVFYEKISTVWTKSQIYIYIFFKT